MIYNVYTDGSYRNVPNVGEFYSSAATIAPADDNSKITVLTKVSSDELVSMRNVAGELMAVLMIFEHCLNVLHLNQNDTVVVHYDYVGIENWTKRKGQPGFWRCKNPTTQAYRDYVNTIVRTSFNVKFVHTPGHTGIEGNELVDKLAYEAINNHLRRVARGNN